MDQEDKIIAMQDELLELLGAITIKYTLENRTDLLKGIVQEVIVAGEHLGNVQKLMEKYR